MFREGSRRYSGGVPGGCAVFLWRLEVFWRCSGGIPQLFRVYSGGVPGGCAVFLEVFRRCSGRLCGMEVFRRCSGRLWDMLISGGIPEVFREAVRYSGRFSGGLPVFQRRF